MTLILDPAWFVAMSGESSPDILVQIDTDASTSYKFCSHPNTQVEGAVVNVDSVTPISTKVDPIKRNVERSQISIKFADDGSLRSLATSTRMHNRRIIVKLGEISLTESQYAPYFLGAIDDIIPEAGAIEIKCFDAFKWPQNFEHKGAMYAKHPLQVIYQLLIDSGVPADLIETNSFDPSQSEYSTISHFNMHFNAEPYGQERSRVSWISNMGPRDDIAEAKVNAYDAIESISEMLIGNIWVNENGKVDFNFYDPAAASVFAFTHDWVKTPITQVSTYSNIINDLEVQVSEVEGENPFRGALRFKDENSQSDFAFPGETELVQQKKAKLLYSNGRATVLGADTTRNTGTLYGLTTIDDGMWVAQHSTDAFAGMRGSHPPGSQPADAKLSPTRIGYYQLGNEVVSTDQPLNIDEYEFAKYREDIDKNGNYTNTRTRTNNFFQVNSPNLSRGQNGTIAANHPVDQVIPGAFYVKDVTMAVNYGRKMLNRFSGGAAEIKIEVPLFFHVFQIGDLVTLEDDLFLGFGNDGLDSSTKFEIIEKTVDPISDNPSIKFTLLQSGETPKTLVELLGGGQILRPKAGPGYGQIITKPFVYDGLFVSKATGTTTDINITRGGVSNGSNLKFIKESTLTLPDLERDNYIFADYGMPSLHVATVAVGTDPLISEDTTCLARVRTDGAGDITDVEILRNTARVTQGTHFEHDTKQGQLIPNADFGDQTFANQVPDGFTVDTGKGPFNVNVRMNTRSPVTGRQVMRLTGPAQAEVRSARRPMPFLRRQGESTTDANAPTIKSSYWIRSDSTNASATHKVKLTMADRQKEIVKVVNIQDRNDFAIANDWIYKTNFQKNLASKSALNINHTVTDNSTSVTGTNLHLSWQAGFYLEINNSVRLVTAVNPAGTDITIEAPFDVTTVPAGTYNPVLWHTVEPAPAFRFAALSVDKDTTYDYNLDFEGLDVRIAKPYFLQYQNAAQPIVKNATTRVNFEVTDNLHSFPTSAIDRTTFQGQITMPYDSVWIMGAVVTMGGGGTTNEIGLELYENGALKRRLQSYDKSGSNDLSVNGIITDFFTAGRTYDIRARLLTANNVDSRPGQTLTYWWGFCLD